MTCFNRVCESCDARLSCAAIGAPEEVEPTTQLIEPEWDELGFIIAYESGELSEDEIITGFQHLIDNGHAWTMQGHYGRTAQALIAAGQCRAKK